MEKCKKCGFVLKGENKFCPKHGQAYIVNVSDDIIELQEKNQSLEEEIQKMRKDLNTVMNKKPIIVGGKNIKRKKTIGDYKEKISEAVDMYMKGQNAGIALKKVLKRGYCGGTDYNHFKAELKKRGAEFEPNRIKKRIKNQCTQKTIEYRQKRMNFIHSRIPSLVKTYSYDYYKAFRMASDEWNKNKIRANITFEKPILIQNENTNNAFLTAIKNMAKFNGEMKYNMDGTMLGFNRLHDWNEFLNCVMLKIVEICNYLNIENKFQIKDNGSGYKLVYR